MKKSFLFLLALVCFFTSCVTTQNASDSFNGAWSEREMAQIASHFVEDFEASALAKGFYYNHGANACVATGYIACEEDFVNATSFSKYIESQMHRLKSVDGQLYKGKPFVSNEEALAWALTQGLDYLISGSIETKVEENENARPLRRYYVRLSVIDLTDGSSVYDWKDEHFTKAVRLVSPY